MKGDLGVVSLGGPRKEETKKSPVFLTGMLTLILIIAYTFALKTYEPAKNILITGGILVYPLSFLIIALISKYYGFKEARKSIFTAAGLYLVFIVLMMICVIPKATNYSAQSYNSMIQFVFTNDFFMIGDTKIFHPTLGQFFGTVIAFGVSHLVYAVIYNALKKHTADYLSMGLGIFIAYIIDRIIFMTLLYAEGLIKGANTFDFFIKCLTSEFIAAILFSIIIIIVYLIIVNIKKSVKKA